MLAHKNKNSNKKINKFFLTYNDIMKNAKKIFKTKSKNKVIEHNPAFGMPDNLGNAKMVKLELEKQDEFNNATINGLLLSNTDNNNTNYKWYELLEFNAEYFVNRFNITSDIIKHEKLIYESIYLGYIYGRAGLYKIQNKIISVSVAMIKHNLLNEIEEVHIIPSVYLLNRSINTNNYKDINKDHIIKLKGNDINNFCLYEWNLKGAGSITKFLKFAKSWEYWLTIINNQKYILKSVISYNVNNTNTITEEMKLFYDPTIAIAAKLNDLQGGKIANNFEVLELKSNLTAQLKDAYLIWKNEMFELFGREFIQDPKAERKITAEVEQGQGNTSTIEYGYFIQIKEYAEKLKDFLNDNSISTKNNIIDKTHINKEQEAKNDFNNIIK